MAIDVISCAVDINEKTVVGFPQANRFEELVVALKKALGPSSGLTSSDVDIDSLTNLMVNYDSDPREWGQYALGDSSRGYTRNLVDEGNGKSNLVRPRHAVYQSCVAHTERSGWQLVLVWSPGKGSPIHDHGNAHCLMKVLRGNLTETRYAFPENGVDESPMRIISEKTYKENGVTYMADELGLHRVSNQESDFAVSLHCEWQR